MARRFAPRTSSWITTPGEARLVMTNTCSVFMSRGGSTRRGLRRKRHGPESVMAEALRAVAIPLHHHAWRSQARDDKHVFSVHEQRRQHAEGPASKGA